MLERIPVTEMQRGDEVVFDGWEYKVSILKIEYIDFGFNVAYLNPNGKSAWQRLESVEFVDRVTPVETGNAQT